MFGLGYLKANIKLRIQKKLRANTPLGDFIIIFQKWNNQHPHELG
jgi:hypothetical protein